MYSQYTERHDSCQTFDLDTLYMFLNNICTHMHIMYICHIYIHIYLYILNYMRDALEIVRVRQCACPCYLCRFLYEERIIFHELAGECENAHYNGVKKRAADAVDVCREDKGQSTQCNSVPCSTASTAHATWRTRFCPGEMTVVVVAPLHSADIR